MKRIIVLALALLVMPALGLLALAAWLASAPTARQAVQVAESIERVERVGERLAGLPEQFISLPAWTGPRRLTLLVMGIDRRDDESARSDTMMLLHLDLDKRRAGLMSIPRDLWVPIAGHGEDRINAAFAYGEASGGVAAGAELARRTVQTLVDQPIDHVVVGDFQCFVQVVDAAGGVTVDVPRKIVDHEFPLEDRIGTITFEPGPQRMDGRRALQYVRTRHTDSDFGRMARQQQVILALARTNLSPPVLLRLPGLANGGCAGAHSDLGARELAALAVALRDLGPSTLSTLMVDEQVAHPSTTAAGAQVLLPDQPGIRRLAADLLAGEARETANR